MDVVSADVKPDVASREWGITPGAHTSHASTNSQTLQHARTHTLTCRSQQPSAEFLYNWEPPQAAQPTGDHLSRLFHFRGDYSLDADYSLNYFQWNNPAGIGAPHDVVGAKANPFMYMLETRTGLFQVVRALSCLFSGQFRRFPRIFRS